MAEGASTLEWLECTTCAAAYAPEQAHGSCACGGVLFARYRLEEAARTLRLPSLSARPATLWRYAEVLPGSDAPVSLSEGMTPLVEAPFLAQSLAMERVWIKDESSEPTGSFKARGMAVAVTMARRAGFKGIVVPSAGNAASAAAAYGARAGLAVEVFVPEDTPAACLTEVEVFGARVHRVAGDLTACGRRAREAAQREGWISLATLREPYRLEGKKTMAYEIVEQLGGRVPDVIVYPTGGGTGLVGMWKGFEEMSHLGWLEGRPRPRMVVVQAEGCAPLVRAFERGDRQAQPWEGARTKAYGLRVPAPHASHLILEVLRASAGTAVAVTDEEIEAAQIECARGEGIFPCPEGAATLAGLRRLREAGWVGPETRVVLFNTGSGLKYPPPNGLRRG